MAKINIGIPQGTRDFGPDVVPQTPKGALKPH
jgi:hypothetical protein